MTKRSVSLVMAVLLLSYIPILEHSSNHDETSRGVWVLESDVERIEISPDPNSIQDLGAPTIYNG